MQRRHNYSYTLEDAYVAYKATTREDIKERITRAQFRKLFDVYFTSMLEHSFDSGNEFKMPYKLGTLYTAKFHKPYFKSFIYDKELKKGVLTTRFNDHTGGYAYTLRWIIRNKDINMYHKKEVTNRLSALFSSHIFKKSKEGIIIPANRILNDYEQKNKYKKTRN